MATKKSRSASIQSTISELIQRAVEDAVSAELQRAEATIEAAVKAHVNAALKTTGGSTKARGGDAKETAVLRWLASNPDSRMEEIARGLRRPSASLKPVMVRLVEERQLRKSGVARGTRYRLSGAAPARTAASSTTARAKGKRVRRSADDLDQMAGRIYSYVAKHPGSRSEEIGRALNAASKDLVRPLKMLLGQGALKAKGKARGTQYTTTGRTPKPSATTSGTGRKKAATKRAAKKKVAKRKSTKKKARKKSAGAKAKSASKPARKKKVTKKKARKKTAKKKIAKKAAKRKAAKKARKKTAKR